MAKLSSSGSSRAYNRPKNGFLAKILKFWAVLGYLEYSDRALTLRKRFFSPKNPRKGKKNKIKFVFINLIFSKLEKLTGKSYIQPTPYRTEIEKKLFFVFLPFLGYFGLKNRFCRVRTRSEYSKYPKTAKKR